MTGLMKEWFYRFAAAGAVPRRWFVPELPAHRPPIPADRPLRIEVVSHCWRYHRFLAYQLSSLVLHPPRHVMVTMTVFHSPEDRETLSLLDAFDRREVPGVTWNWRALSPERLFRRAIGRNLAARDTDSDWIWFSDCDVVFHAGALDAAGAELRGRQDRLVFPREHGVSDILEEDDPLFERVDGAGEGSGRLVAIDPSEFRPEVRDRAVGGFQIVRSDVAGAAGYCGTIPHYQRPAKRWLKTYEDRTFRWLMGSHGTPIEVPGLYRIRHATKGRDPASRGGRGWLRRLRQGPTGRQR